MFYCRVLVRMYICLSWPFLINNIDFSSKFSSFPKILKPLHDVENSYTRIFFHAEHDRNICFSIYGHYDEKTRKNHQICSKMANFDKRSFSPPHQTKTANYMNGSTRRQAICDSSKKLAFAVLSSHSVIKNDENHDFLT